MTIQTKDPQTRQAWQHRGRCTKCGTKTAGCRRVRHCVCGGRVVGQ